MARGITETDVHTAADELVAAGERPTVERIRAHLGTGSPNTVTRWLDTWWQGLGMRLQTERTRLTIPAAPEAIAILAGEWWERALAAARDECTQALAAERDAVRQDHEALNEERASLAAEAIELRTQLAAARHAEQVATTQAAELERLVEQLQRQANELVQQRDTALARCADLEIARDALQRQLQRVENLARAERERLSQHIRATEDRAHAEVDRARLEAKDLASQLAALKKEHASLDRQYSDSKEQTRLKVAEISQELAAQRARADAMGAQLEKLESLPAALEAAWRASGSGGQHSTKKRQKAQSRAAPKAR
jgi:chromosome segregation ATPase